MTDYDPNNPLAGATNCPHCGGLAKVSPHPELRFVCNVCGAPRIETKGASLSGRERPALEQTRVAVRHRLFWKIGAVLGFSSAAFIFVISLVGMLFSATWGLLGGLVFGVPWVVLGVLAVARAKGKTAEVRRLLDEAWRSAARDLVHASQDGITARDLATRMGIDEATAENLIAEVSIDDSVRSRMTDDGRIVVAPVEGLRIDTAPTQPALDPLEEKFAALEAAEAEAAEAKKRTL